MSALSILISLCTALIIVLPCIAFFTQTDFSGFFSAWIFLFVALWGMMRVRRGINTPLEQIPPELNTSEQVMPKQKETTEKELPLSPHTQQIANDIIITYVGVMYDKARMLPDFDAEKEEVSMFMQVMRALDQHDLTLDDAAQEQLRDKFTEAIKRGLREKGEVQRTKK